MKIKIGNTEIEAKTLEIVAPIEYWEDCEVDLPNDDYMRDRVPNDLIPCRDDENNWCPIIDLDTGKITNWQEGFEARTWFKVRDEGSYYLKDEEGEVVAKIEQSYAPTLIDLTGRSFGDYLYFSIDEKGQIKDWKPNTKNMEQEWELEENKITVSWKIK